MAEVPKILPKREALGETLFTVDPYNLVHELDRLISTYGTDPTKNEDLLIGHNDALRIAGVIDGLKSALVPTQGWEGHLGVAVRPDEELRVTLMTLETDTEMADRDTGIKTRGKVDALRWVLGIKPEGQTSKSS